MASHTEVRREQTKFRQACDVIKSMRTDLHSTSGFIQDVNRLKIAVRVSHFSIIGTFLDLIL